MKSNDLITKQLFEDPIQTAVTGDIGRRVDTFRDFLATHFPPAARYGCAG